MSSVIGKELACSTPIDISHPLLARIRTSNRSYSYFLTHELVVEVLVILQGQKYLYAL